MTQQTQVGAATMHPFARYEDAQAAVEWLGRAFGLERRMVVPSDDGGVAHAELGLGGSVFMLGSAGGTDIGVQSPKRVGTATCGIYVVIEDVDAHCERARAAGAEITREPEDTPCGSREYSARDLEGHPWSFGTYAPGSEG
jgi:uncharacterized glyoxalase superfamily protein PhnB